MTQLNINTKGLVKFTNKLEKMHRSDLPIAIRGTLTKAAVNMKKETLPKSAESTFEKRHRGQFYKANSRFEGAKGFDVKVMKSTVGFVETLLKGQNNYSVQDLEDQEIGGTLTPDRPFLPLDTARVGKKRTGRVRDENRISKIPFNKIINASRVAGRSKKQKYVRAAIIAKEAFGNEAYVLGGSGTRRVLYRINDIRKTGPKGVKINSTPLYSIIRGNVVKVKARPFRKQAALLTGGKIEKFFVEEAKRRFAKAAAK